LFRNFGIKQVMERVDNDVNERHLLS
jgi:hypothetical protein